MSTAASRLLLLREVGCRPGLLGLSWDHNALCWVASTTGIGFLQVLRAGKSKVKVLQVSLALSLSAPSMLCLLRLLLDACEQGWGAHRHPLVLGLNIPICGTQFSLKAMSFGTQRWQGIEARQGSSLRTLRREGFPQTQHHGKVSLPHVPGHSRDPVPTCCSPVDKGTPSL